MKPIHPRPVFSVFTLLALLLTLLGSAVFATPAYAASITVNTPDDELNNDGDCSLREAVQAANTDAAVDACAAGSGADVITLPAGTYTLIIAGTNEDANATGDLDIRSDLTLQGDGSASTILQAGTLGYPYAGANGIDRILHLANSGLYGAPYITVNISGLSLSNGRSVGNVGAAIMLVNTNLTLTDTFFSGNFASYPGGAIYSMGSLTMDDSAFYSNSGQYGGAIYHQTGGLTISNSSFENNVASGSNGGGAIGAVGNVTIYNSTFAYNRAPSNSGGAIYYYGYAGEALNLRNSTFSGNSANTGGALYVGGTAHLYNNILADSGSPSNFNNPMPDCRNAGTMDGSNNLLEMDDSSYPCGTNLTGTLPGVDPQLDTPISRPAYFMLPVTSPALDAGDNSICAAAPVSGLDQNGIARPQGINCDLGSSELLLTPGILLTESGGSTDVVEGLTTDTYTLMLTSPPASDVTITITPDAQLTVDVPSVTFTSANWNTPRTITVSAVNDGFGEGAHTGTITHSASSSDGAYDAISIPDVVANITERSLSLSTASLDFGNQLLGTTSAPLPVTITNNGSADVSISSVSPSGDFAISSNTCTGASLAPTATCSINVTFTPTVVGTRTGQLSINSNTLTSPALVDLTGVGIAPQVGLSTNSLAFGNVLVGTLSGIQTVTITNLGNASLNINVLDSSGDFFVASYGCMNGALLPGGTCTVDMIFAPWSVGYKTGTLNIYSDAPSSPDPVSLSGTGIAGEIQILPSPLDFGNQMVGTTTVRTVTITNIGAADLHIGTLGIPAGNFGITNNTCNGATLVPLAACTFDVTFAPPYLGLNMSEISIPSDSGGIPGTDAGQEKLYPLVDYLSLTGNGVAGKIKISPILLDFGDRPVGTTTVRAVTISNIGSGDLHLGTLSLPAGNFGITNNTCSGATLVPLATCTFNVTFTPSSAGLKTSQVSIPSDSGGMPVTDAGQEQSYPAMNYLPLSGNGIASNLTLTFTSRGGSDGTVRESARDSGVGGYMESVTALISIGDDYLHRQYVGILDFNTSTLPAKAVITSVKLRVKGMILSSTTYARLGEMTADIVNPFFGAFPRLEIQDFQSPALARNIGTFTHAPSYYQWITLTVNPTRFIYINRTGNTQFRLHFQKKYFADTIKQQLRFLSGNYSNPADHPQLIINYYLP